MFPIVRGVPCDHECKDRSATRLRRRCAVRQAARILRRLECMYVALNRSCAPASRYLSISGRHGLSWTGDTNSKKNRATSGEPYCATPPKCCCVQPKQRVLSFIVPVSFHRARVVPSCSRRSVVLVPVIALVLFIAIDPRKTGVELSRGYMLLKESGHIG